jgi:hypothetical protein
VYPARAGVEDFLDGGIRSSRAVAKALLAPACQGLSGVFPRSRVPECGHQCRDSDSTVAAGQVGRLGVLVMIPLGVNAGTCLHGHLAPPLGSLPAHLHGAIRTRQNWSINCPFQWHSGLAPVATAEMTATIEDRGFTPLKCDQDKHLINTPPRQSSARGCIVVSPSGAGGR